MSSISENNFIERCQRGESLLDEIDDFIDDWHENQDDLELHEFLGMTWDEYSLWIKEPNTLSSIINRRRCRHQHSERISSSHPLFWSPTLVENQR